MNLTTCCILLYVLNVKAIYISKKWISRKRSYWRFRKKILFLQINGTVGYCAGQCPGQCPLQCHIVGYSAGQCHVQWRSVVLSRSLYTVQWRTVGYSGVKCWLVEMYNESQWHWKCSEVQFKYSRCSKISVKFRSNRMGEGGGLPLFLAADIFLHLYTKNVYEIEL